MSRKPKRPAKPADSGDPSPRTLYAAIGALLAVMLIGMGAWLWLGAGGNPVGGIGGPFTLIDGNGKTVTDRDYRGKYMLVYFGYTFCPDVCPTTLNAVSDALDRLGPKADRITTLFITVDPKRDNAAAVKQYAAAFGPRVVGLTGSVDQIKAAAKAYRVYYAEHRTGPGPDEYSMDHSSVLYLMGPDGTFVAPLRAEQSGADIATALARFVSP